MIERTRAALRLADAALEGGDKLRGHPAEQEQDAGAEDEGTEAIWPAKQPFQKQQTKKNKAHAGKTPGSQSNCGPADQRQRLKR